MNYALTIYKPHSPRTRAKCQAILPSDRSKRDKFAPFSGAHKCMPPFIEFSEMWPRNWTGLVGCLCVLWAICPP